MRVGGILPTILGWLRWRRVVGIPCRLRMVGIGGRGGLGVGGLGILVEDWGFKAQIQTLHCPPCSRYLRCCRRGQFGVGFDLDAFYFLPVQYVGANFPLVLLIPLLYLLRLLLAFFHHLMLLLNLFEGEGVSCVQGEPCLGVQESQDLNYHIQIGALHTSTYYFHLRKLTQFFSHKVSQRCTYCFVPAATYVYCVGGL